METRRSFDDDNDHDSEAEAEARVEVAALALDCFASPTWEAWDALVAAAEQRQVDLQKLLLSPTEEGRLLDGSRLVRSSLGYGEKREIGQGLELFMGPEGLSMYRMMTGCGEEVTQETLDARLAAAAEAMEARRAEEAPRAAAERASEHSTALSRFDTSMPAADATPLEGVAQWIVEARCEDGPLAGSAARQALEEQAVERRAFGLQGGGAFRRVGFSAGARACACEPTAAADGDSGALVWLSEGCGGRIKCMQAGATGGRCVATLRNVPDDEFGTPHVAVDLARIDVGGRRLLVATAGGGELAWWNIDALDPSTGGHRSHEYDSAARAHALRSDAMDTGREHPVALLSVADTEGICHHEEGIEEMEVTEGERPHGTWDIGAPLERQKSSVSSSSSRWRSHASGPTRTRVEHLCWLSNPAWLAIGFDGRGTDGNGVLGGEVVSLFDVAAGRSAGSLFGHAPNDCDHVTCLGCLAAGGEALPRTLASACSDGTVRVWDVASRRPSFTLIDKAGGDTSAMAFAPVGGTPLLFTGASDCAVRLWDLRHTGRCVHELATGNARVEHLAWDPAGRALLALTRRPEVERRRRQRMGGGLFGLAFGANGGSSDEDEDEEDAWNAWPRDAQHGESDFGVRWDLPSGDYGLAQYRFMPLPRQPAHSYERQGQEPEPATWRYISEAYGAGIGLSAV